jgi:hypothetical protein
MTNSSTAKSTTAPSSGFTDFVLKQLRCVGLRTMLIGDQIDALGVALRGGIISQEMALLGLHECGAMGLIMPSSAEAA